MKTLKKSMTLGLFVGLTMLLAPIASAQLPVTLPDVPLLEGVDLDGGYDEVCTGNADGSTEWCEEDWGTPKNVEFVYLLYCPEDASCDPTSGILHNNLFNDNDENTWAYFWHNFLDGSPVSSCQEFDHDGNGFTKMIGSLTPDTTSVCPDAQPNGDFGAAVSFHEGQDT